MNLTLPDKKNAALLGSLVLLSVCMAGCGNAGGVGPNTTSRVRFLNALVLGPSQGVDLVQRGLIVTSGVAVTFDSVAPPITGISPLSTYYTVPAGGNSLSGSGVDTDCYPYPLSTGTPVAPQQSFFLAPNTPGQSDGTYTVAVAGIVGSSTAPPTIFRFIDSAPSISQSLNVTYLRVINLAPDTVSTTGLTLDSNGQAVAGLSGITYGAVSSSSNYVAIPLTNSAPLSFTLTFGAANQPVTTTTPLNSLNLSAGHAYTLFLTGEVNPTGGATGITPVITEDE